MPRAPPGSGPLFVGTAPAEPSSMQCANGLANSGPSSGTFRDVKRRLGRSLSDQDGVISLLPTSSPSDWSYVKQETMARTRSASKLGVNRETNTPAAMAMRTNLAIIMWIPSIACGIVLAPECFQPISNAPRIVSEQCWRVGYQAVETAIRVRCVPASYTPLVLPQEGVV